MIPKVGEWYLSVRCDRCNCTILVFHDLNNGHGNISGEYRLSCLRCMTTQSLPVEHYQHREGAKTDICIEII